MRGPGRRAGAGPRKASGRHTGAVSWELREPRGQGVFAQVSGCFRGVRRNAEVCRVRTPEVGCRWPVVKCVMPACGGCGLSGELVNLVESEGWRGSGVDPAAVPAVGRRAP